ncbi:hypothetical protein LC087_08155 [Bacillus carboniphilus]|uniref:Uncharacterized protein n=1 Tax=Bacillus carboniphilus TaxID=86663 RepID=A0ABY9JZT4_9BACI|nr:hypothetical protein [Bacillus carboniphilus]WLR44057.1 hypothetical protein LC087_08155 [Bacillus carboniphilus]
MKKQHEVFYNSQKVFFDRWGKDAVHNIAAVLEREKPFDRKRHFIPIK